MEQKSVQITEDQMPKIYSKHNEPSIERGTKIISDFLKDIKPLEPQKLEFNLEKLMEEFQKGLNDGLSWMASKDNIFVPWYNKDEITKDNWEDYIEIIESVTSDPYSDFECSNTNPHNQFGKVGCKQHCDDCQNWQPSDKIIKLANVKLKENQNESNKSNQRNENRLQNREVPFTGGEKPRGTKFLYHGSKSQIRCGQTPTPTRFE